MIPPLLTALLTLLFPPLLLAGSTIDSVLPFECGTDASHASSALLNTVKDLHKRSLSSPPLGSPASRAKLLQRRQNPVSIDAAFHVVHTPENAAMVAPDASEKQLAALNKAFGPAGFAFKLVDSTVTANAKWATGEAPEEMKAALRKGSYATLNIYFLTDMAGGNLGKCSMPSEIGPPGQPVEPSAYVDDGCMVNAATMPGGSMLGYDEGMTAVHETGHWMGLFHVFEGNACSGDGDFIEDTPMQSMSTNGCPAKKNSCPDLPGEDAVHNIMDYSVDQCYEGFSKMQVLRMADLWNTFREGK